MTRRDFLKTGMAGTFATPVLRLPHTSPLAPGSPPPITDGRKWWFEARFGMFVHWGLYAIHGWHEQEQWRRRVPRADYTALRHQWNPVRFDPEQWLDLAEAAGMKYLCFTTKHHDGFCLWDTKQTAYNTMNTPYGKDILGQLADACHRRSFPLCLYYSIVDWHQPNYPNQARHHELPPQPGDTPDWERYLAFVKAQVRELCTNYGTIHGFWWDLNVPEHRDPSFNQLIRQLQPSAMINNRGFDAGDFGTPERDLDNAANAKTWFETPVEACQSVGYQSWGYREDEDYYTDDYLVRSIHRMLARGGNYLLNVGPKADGTIPDESTGLLRRIGSWIAQVRPSLWDVTQAGVTATNRDVLLTRRGTTVYAHLIREPETSSVFLHPLSDLPRKATLLNTGAPLHCVVDYLPRQHNQPPERALVVKHLPGRAGGTHGWVLKLDFGA